MNDKFRKLDKYSDIMESNNKVMDNLKTSVNAKMMVFEDQIAVT